MSKLEAFQSLFVERFQPELLRREADRKKAVFRIFFGLILLITVGVSSFFLYHRQLILAIVIGLGLFALAIYNFFKAYKFHQELQHYFKSELIPVMIQLIHPNLNYAPKASVSQANFDASKIFKFSYDEFKGEDGVRATVGQTEIEFSEVQVVKINRDSKGAETRSVQFQGIFFLADFHKNFHGETFVLKDSAQGLFGSLGTSLQRANLLRPELVLMENPVFEKQFVVYSTDQVESRYLITPVLMEKMLEMNSKFKGIQFSFVNSKLFVAIPLKENMFEYRLFKKFSDTSYIEQYFKVLQDCVGIVETLDLNTRIWSKA